MKCKECGCGATKKMPELVRGRIVFQDYCRDHYNEFVRDLIERHGMSCLTCQKPIVQNQATTTGDDYFIRHSKCHKSHQKHLKRIAKQVDEYLNKVQSLQNDLMNSMST